MFQLTGETINNNNEGMSPYSSLALSSTSTIPLNPTARVPVHFACGHNPPHTRGGSAFPPRPASSKRRRRDVPAVPADEPVPPLSLAIKRQLMNLLSGHYAGVERAREEQRAGRRGGAGGAGEGRVLKAASTKPSLAGSGVAASLTP